MRKFISATMGMAVLAFAAVTTAPVALAQGHGRGLGHGHGGFADPSFAGPRYAGPPTWQGSNPPGFSRGGKAGWRGNSVPPGWA